MIAAIAVLTAACATALSVSKKVYIGMPVEDFRKIAGSAAELETMTVEATVYRMDVCEGEIVVGAKYFHFDSQGCLFQMYSRDFRDNHRGRGHGERERVPDRRP